MTTVRCRKEVKTIKIIDFCKKGNLLRLYLGADDCKNYWGDDWNDKPYEHNAGCVYDEYIEAVVDLVVTFDGAFIEPADDWAYSGSTPFSKEDFKLCKTPCILVVSQSVAEQYWSTEEYIGMIGNKDVMKIYFNDKFDDTFCKQLWDNDCRIYDAFVPIREPNGSGAYLAVTCWAPVRPIDLLNDAEGTIARIAEDAPGE